MEYPILSLVILIPVLGSGLILLSSAISNWKKEAFAGSIAVISAAITFVLTAYLILKFDPNSGALQFTEDYQWIRSLNIHYQLGIDGLSVAMVFLTALIFLLAMVSSLDISSGAPGYFTLFLFLESGVLGTFLAQDLFLFLMFWIATLLPIYFLTSVWGGKNRETTANRFFLFQLTGSGVLLVSFLSIYYLVEPHRVTIPDLLGGLFSSISLPDALSFLGLSGNQFFFLLIFLGLSTRLIVFPLHSWFANLQAEAPTALGVIVASVFLKTATYALLRINYQIFPSAAEWFAPILTALGVINVLYGAACATVQQNIRKTIAYCCLSQMGFILLALGSFTATASQGAIVHALSSGIFVALLFFLAGILNQRSGELRFEDKEGKSIFGGLTYKAPVLTGVLLVGIFSTLGAPGFCGFSSGLLIFLGSYPMHRVATLICVGGFFLSAGYLLVVFRKIVLGPSGTASLSVTDFSLREKLYIFPLVMVSIFIGVYPEPLVKLSQATVLQLLTKLTGGGT
ncbi:MAG: NuoM family protein [Bacteriovoracia bacterium]